MADVESSASSAPSAWKWFAVTFSVVALIMSFIAVGITAFSEDNGGGGRGGTAAGTGGTIELSEFKITGDLSVPQGSSVTVKNVGTTAHNLSVKDGPKTSDIQPGQSANLDLSSLDPGEYEVTCTVSGHEAAGMHATLTITESGSAASVPSSGAGETLTEADYKKMSDAMSKSIEAYLDPKLSATKGLGNQPLAPKIAADGTKEFDLTAKITKWEVSPGKVVDAWTYNGTVPGPVIHVEPGDHVRVTLHNQLPQGTDMHIHGISLPNDMDGVAPLTQPLIEPGKSFTYDFMAEGPALGMYHAHHMGQRQVPNGLLGVFEIGEMPMPAGGIIGGRAVPAGIKPAQKIQMVLNDAGTIGLSLNGKSFPGTQKYTSHVGDWVQINYFNEGVQIHPMHPHQFPQLVIAKDGIPLDSPYWADTLDVAPGERYTVLIHTDKPGAWVWHCHILNHVESDDGVFGMLTAFVVS